MHKYVKELIKNDLISYSKDPLLMNPNPFFLFREMVQIYNIIRKTYRNKQMIYFLTEDVSHIEFIGDLCDELNSAKKYINVVTGNNKDLHSRNYIKEPIPFVLSLDNHINYSERILKREIYSRNRFFSYPLSSKRFPDSYPLDVKFDNEGKIAWFMSFIRKVNLKTQKHIKAIRKFRKTKLQRWRKQQIVLKIIREQQRLAQEQQRLAEIERQKKKQAKWEKARFYIQRDKAIKEHEENRRKQREERKKQYEKQNFHQKKPFQHKHVQKDVQNSSKKENYKKENYNHHNNGNKKNFQYKNQKNFKQNPNPSPSPHMNKFQNKNNKKDYAEKTKEFSKRSSK